MQLISDWFSSFCFLSLFSLGVVSLVTHSIIVIISSTLTVIIHSITVIRLIFIVFSFSILNLNPSGQQLPTSSAQKASSSYY